MIESDSRFEDKMAKSSRASSKKANNQRLKKGVFGPVETARQERLSAKLLELASQPKPVPERDMDDVSEKGVYDLRGSRRSQSLTIGTVEAEQTKTDNEKTQDSKSTEPLITRHGNDSTNDLY